MFIKRVSSVISATLLTFSALVAAPQAAIATTAESYDFNTTGQLSTNFDASLGAGYTSSNYSQSTTGGIANSGAINAPSSLNAVFGSKSSYSLGDVGTKYTFSSYMKSVGNSGYSGMGFSVTPSSTNGSTPFRPSDALGISVHGGGFVFHNGGTDYSANWQNGSVGSITAVTSAGINDLLNSGSADQWYKIIFSIDVLAGAKFTMRVEVWPADGSNGNLRNGSASAIFEVRNISNSTISNAATIKSYINFSGYRVTYFDNFNVDLTGNSSVISAGAPVVLTNANSVSGSQITFNGNVTSENGSTVTDRGFVYATHSSPTVSDTKVSVGTGTGTFTSTTANLAGGTYYVRAFATNSTGTSYGAEQTTTITETPTLTWAPTNTSAYVSAATITPSSTATSNSSGGISYSIYSAGTTGCTVNNSTAVLSFSAAGSCVVRATVAAAGAYTTATVDRTFTINANTVPGAPSSVVAVAGDETVAISWTAPASNGGSAITTYTVTATPGGATCSATAPATTCDVSHLTNGTAYTFAVTATNTTGTSLASASSAAVTPTAPVVTPAPSSGGGGSLSPVTPTPPPAPAARVAAVEITAGKAKGTSVIKLKMADVPKNSSDADIQIKLIDTTGKVIKVLSVPMTGTDTNSIEVSLAMPVGEFTVEASTVNSAGGATAAVSQSAILIPRPYFQKVAANVAPVLQGVKASNPITFKPSSAVLTPTAKAKLIQLATQLKATKSKIALTGFSANTSMSMAFKMQLATKRAVTVANFLKSQGLGSVIYYSGYGPLNPQQYSGTPRKVEVRIVK